MSQYLLSVWHVEGEELPTDMAELQPMFDAVGVFNDKLRAEGAWVFAGGLHPIEAATTVDGQGGQPILTDGPFAESKEWMGGFWVIEAADLDAALAWATEGSAACRGKVEVRPFQDEPEVTADGADAAYAVERIFREEYGRVVASLARRFGSLDVAEDAAADALVTALERWPRDGVPPNPGAWLTTTAGNRAIDRLRRESHRDAKHQAATALTDDTPHAPTGLVEDDLLRLVFTCCHPALAPEARVALTLRLLGGLTVAEIAAAFLVPETTMAQRITRAKRKIGAARIPFRVPTADDLPSRLAAVLAVVYLVFNEGYLSSSAEVALRDDLTAEAIRLARILRALLPGEQEVTGLLALMLLTEARRTTRLAGGELVTLAEQDRSEWDRSLVAEGHALVRECLAVTASSGVGPGHYQLLAAVNAVHTDATTAEDTDWSQIAALYAQLAAIAPGPIVELNRAVAIAELDGPAVALAAVEGLAGSGPGPGALASYHAFHVTRAELLRRLDRRAEAIAAYDDALALVDNPAERAYLIRRRREVG